LRFRKLTLALAVLAAACGGAAPTTSSPTTITATSTTPATSTTAPETTTDAPTSTAALPRFPVTVQSDNGAVTIEARPESIVSLSPTATEMLFAIGAGDQVVAVDEFSNYPEEAPTTDLSGFTPNVEALSVYEPDLVVVSYDPGDLVASLDALGIPVLVQGGAVVLDDTYHQIEQLGLATGHTVEALAAIDQIMEGISDVVASLPAGAEGLTYYYELGPDLFTATSTTFVGQLFAMLGLVDVADEADSDGAAFGYPQLSEEYLIDANPDLIFLADTVCCAQTAATVAERAGWDAMTAVTSSGIVELNDDVASRWGPRVVELLAIVGDAIQERGT
jgi:cobalamin transport system substrate-binding protein